MGSVSLITMAGIHSTFVFILTLLVRGVVSKNFGLANIIDIVRALEFSYEDSTLVVVPIDGWQISIELLEGTLHGVTYERNGYSQLLPVVAGVQYKAIYGHHGRRVTRT